MLMQHCDDGDNICFVHKIDGIGKLVKQGAAHILFNNRKHQRIVIDMLECRANFAEESET